MLYLLHSKQIVFLFSHQYKNYKGKRMHLESCQSLYLDTDPTDLLIKYLNYTSISVQAFLFQRLVTSSGSNQIWPMNYARFYLQFQQKVEISRQQGLEKQHHELMIYLPYLIIHVDQKNLCFIILISLLLNSFFL